MLRVRQIKIDVKKDSASYLKEMLAKKLKVNLKDILKIKMIKKSIDARKKPEVFYVYEVDVLVNGEESVLKLQREDVFPSPKEEYHFPECKKKYQNRPIIVGSGPAGLFTAYLLAEHGYKPLILERGEKIGNRIKSVENFWNTGILNLESNVQFGEGGAGTFSDGKLNTMVKDKFFRGKKAFEIFVECGAEESILYESHPHIGTDKLREFVKNMREKIIEMGGEFRYESKMTNLKIKDNCIQKIEVNKKEWLDVDCLVLAIGHSARDTFELLYEKNVFLEPKPFAVGLRVMHSQKIINEAQYGATSIYLPPASYKLTYTTKEKRGVYSFCMCPGGYVVNASSEPNRLCINGMSEKNRDSENANSAIVVTIFKEDYGSTVLGALKFQRDLEEKAYQLGNGKIPVQLYKDFKRNQKSEAFKSVKPITKGATEFANLKEKLPAYILNSIEEAMPYFGTKIKGFDDDDTLLCGVEARTSSPIRITRDEKGECNIKGIFPCGEGSGYAGGITSSAMDGILCAENIVRE